MIAGAGLDHVRLPVRFSAHALSAPPYTVDHAFFERVDWAIDQASARGLSVIVDFHHYEEMATEPDAHADRFVGIWRQVAARYAGRPDTVAFELLNEPNEELTPDRWNKLVRRSVEAIRATNPHRWLIVDSYFWAAPDRLANLDLPNDPRLVASFHMYQPILFTHQGAHWMTGEYQTTGLVFPGPPPKPVQPVAAALQVAWVKSWFEGYNTLPLADNPGGPKAVFEQFAHVDRFVQSSGRPVYLGEFAAIDKADEQSRANFVYLVRTEAERRNIAWAYWDDGGNSAAMNVKGGTWVESLRHALLE
jgi:endoglucanase